MHIIVNGERREIEGNITVSDLLEKLGVDVRKAAVECNRAIVPKSLHAETEVAEGDEIEIVAFIGGG